MPLLNILISPSGKHIMTMTYRTATCQAHKDDPRQDLCPLVLTLKSHARARCPFTKRKRRLREAQRPQVQADVTTSQPGSFCL